MRNQRMKTFDADELSTPNTTLTKTTTTHRIHSLTPHSESVFIKISCFQMVLNFFKDSQYFLLYFYKMSLFPQNTFAFQTQCPACPKMFLIFIKYPFISFQSLFSKNVQNVPKYPHFLTLFLLSKNILIFTKSLKNV